jgi:hypothetical protein
LAFLVSQAPAGARLLDEQPDSEERDDRKRKGE